jgi:exodeoxyribonuclease V alpha subunit
MSYTGVYDKTIYYNPVSKYCVISVKTNDQSIPQKARSAFQHRDRLIRFTAVGYELPQTDRVSMILNGEWQNGKYGPQLQVESCEEIVPQTKDGVRGYLSSRLIKGVGEKTADLIVECFGADALQILEKQPERLLEIVSF